MNKEIKLLWAAVSELNEKNDALEKSVSAFKSLLIALSEDSAIKKKTKTKADSKGSEVWAEYLHEFKTRHTFEPPRSARTNRHCNDLIKAIGLEDAKLLVRFYIRMDDAFYMNNAHDLRFAVRDCQGIYARMQTHSWPTHRQLIENEKARSNADASQAFLSRKNGKN